MVAKIVDVMHAWVCAHGGRSSEWRMTFDLCYAACWANSQRSADDTRRRYAFGDSAVFVLCVMLPLKGKGLTEYLVQILEGVYLDLYQSCV